MQKIRKGDDVVVIAGKDKGRRGTVLRLEEFDRIVVEGVNVAKKHVRGNPQRGVEGGIIEQAMSIHKSNVMLYNPIAKKGDKVGIRTLEDGKKVRVFKSTDEVVDV
ncbi:MAG: 50S ribosomal protein L24 [Pseudomonadota bacterium]